MRDIELVPTALGNPRPVTTLSLAVGTFLLIAVAGAPIVSSVLLLDAAAGVAVPAAVVFSVPGAIAVGVGSFAARLATGAEIATAALRSVTHVVIGTVGLITYRATRASDRVEAIPGPSWLPACLFASVQGAVTGAVVLGWGLAVAGVSPFFLTTGYTVSYVVSGLLFGLPLLFALHYVAGPFQPKPTAGIVTGSAIVIVVPYLWLLLGTIGSIGYHSFDVLYSYDPKALEVIGLAFLDVLYNDALFGPGAVRVQAALGGAMSGVLVLAVWRSITNVAERIDR